MDIANPVVPRIICYLSMSFAFDEFRSLINNDLDLLSRFDFYQPTNNDVIAYLAFSFHLEVDIPSHSETKSRTNTSSN